MIDKGINNQIGESDEFYSFQENLRKAAAVDRSVLLIGERGSGKEFAASRLHYLSSRWKNSFVKLNCAALPQTLIETELFGHVKGAYTGADRERRGRFEEAGGGTLFLDEIGLIPLEVQEKILRVVEYGTFERVGSSETKEVDVRIIGAANQDLPSLCREGKFKQDLLDRLSFEVLFVPPLRARKGDILILADHFARKMGRELGISGEIGFSENVRHILESYSWPGNIRELKNTIERAVYRSSSNLVEEIVLDPFINPYSMSIEDEGSSSEEENYSLSAEREKIIHSQIHFDGNKSEPPESGSFSRKTFDKLFKAMKSASHNTDDEKDTVSFRDVTDFVKKELIASALAFSENNQKKAAMLLELSYDQFRGLYKKYFI